MDNTLPYRIAVLCYLFDQDGRILLIHRRKQPNRDLYSPIGGKLERDNGESPTACAMREIHEEAGLEIGPDRLHLTGIISEKGFGQECHWLMFLYEVTGPVAVAEHEFSEGRLEWHQPQGIDDLSLPATDAHVIWPLFWRYRGGFFMAHIDCTGSNLMWRLEQPSTDSMEGFATVDQEPERVVGP